jgi:antitoxin FitA
MATLTIRNIPESLHRALRVRASRHDHSMQAEVRDILEAAILQRGPLRLGSLLADISRQATQADATAAASAPIEHRKRAGASRAR